MSSRRHGGDRRHFGGRPRPNQAGQRTLGHPLLAELKRIAEATERADAKAKAAKARPKLP